MVNKTKKGSRYELEARKILEAAGYLVEKKNASRWQSNDFWGLFDLLAVKTCKVEDERKSVRLIQIKTNKNDVYKAKKEIMEWHEEHELHTQTELSFEVWLREPRKKWQCSMYEGDN